MILVNTAAGHPGFTGFQSCSTCDKRLGISFSTEELALSTHVPGLISRPLIHAPLLLDTHTAIRRGDDSKLVNAFVRAYHRKYKDLGGKPPTLFPM